MKEYYITIKNGTKVPVTEEVYTEYYKMARRERYYEHDIKKGKILIDSKTEDLIFIPNKEDSMERLMELGEDFASNENIENVAIDKAMLLILQEATKALNVEEQEIISNIYYKNMTTREISKKNNLCQTSVIKRHKKVLEKLKKYFL